MKYPKLIVLFYLFLVLTTILIQSDACAQQAPVENEADGVYFRVRVFTRKGQGFNYFAVKITDPQAIARARDVMAGGKPAGIFGIVANESVCYNAPWSYSLVPESVRLSEVAIDTLFAPVEVVETDVLGTKMLPGYQSNWIGHGFIPAAQNQIEEIPAPDCSKVNLATVSAASYFRSHLATGGIAASFGTGLSLTTASATSLPLPQTLTTTSVRIRDKNGTDRLASLFFVSPNQINYLIPDETPEGPVEIQVLNGSVMVARGLEYVNQVGASLFSGTATGNGVAGGLILRARANGTQSYELLSRYDEVQKKAVPLPIDLGDDRGELSDKVYLVLFGTGFRAIRPTDEITWIASNYTSAGAFLTAQYMGLQPDYPGLDQANILLTRDLKGAGDLNVNCNINLLVSNIVQINIK